LPEIDVFNALSQGKGALQNEIIDRMANKIGKVNPFNNGITPYTGNIIFYAQHATGTCCRRCMDYWYKFPMKDVALTDLQIDFSANLINLYLNRRLPQLYM
jgi:hypothetical protein